MLRKRLYPVFGLVIAGLLLLTACTPKAGGNAPVKITIFVGFGAGSDADSQVALKAIADEYNARLHCSYSIFKNRKQFFPILMAFSVFS